MTICVELNPVPDVLGALRRFADLPALLLLDSARRDTIRGRYTFLTADPVELVRLNEPILGKDPFARTRSFDETEALEGLPPFQGGYAGLLGYELGRTFENLPEAVHDEFELPTMVCGLFDWVIAWDHQADRCWIISQGFPASGAARQERADRRLQQVRRRLNADPVADSMFSPSTRLADPPHGADVVPGHPGVFSNFSRDAYLDALRRVIEYVRAGDIFQANLAQRLVAKETDRRLDLYDRLRRCNAAPFAGYFACDDWAVLSASPERFINVVGSDVSTRPIKGTRRRSPVPEADLFTRDELRESGKDRAENVMIVDLLRNDLSKVCEPGSIRVPQLCTVETFATVQHLVSEVTGRLRENCSVWDLFAATFPGGSITGAPKIRAMEIIAELEMTARGPYCGSLFYVSCTGHADSNILIRTFTCRGGWIQCPVGGGITAQSVPADEYDETMDKAAGMLRALRSDRS